MVNTLFNECCEQSACSSASNLSPLFGYRTAARDVELLKKMMAWRQRERERHAINVIVRGKCARFGLMLRFSRRGLRHRLLFRLTVLLRFFCRFPCAAVVPMVLGRPWIDAKKASSLACLVRAAFAALFASFAKRSIVSGLRGGIFSVLVNQPDCGPMIVDPPV